ncbi:hypothetical protein JCM8208_003785 [Rhodotorula glutinis]
MGFFLRSRFVTHVLVLVGMVCASFATFVYAWQFRGPSPWHNPSTFTKAIKILAMVSHALFAAQSLLTWHSLRLTSKSLSFGLWATFGFASIVADSWWFGLMVSRQGFESLCGDDGGDCVRKSVSIASCVFFGVYGVYRLFVILVVWHFDVHFNETFSNVAPPAMTAAAPTAYAPSMSMAQWAAVPSPTASMSAPTAAGHKLHSLAKAMRPTWPSRRDWAQLARWTPVDDGKGDELDRRERGVPLIAVSLHDADYDGGRYAEGGAGAGAGAGAGRPPRRSSLEGDDDERGILFDADLGERSARSADAKMRAKPGDDSSDLSSSSDEHSSDDEGGAQAAYEARRAARRSARSSPALGAGGAGGSEAERGRYAQV